ncbi:MAG: RluA family pseudouridine synthase [Verrucomicrobia bacterium]|nr:RluA family pseudouridine synthase [Verrucomicrobiota bacterium]
MQCTIKEPMPLLEALQLLCPDSSKNSLRQFLSSGRVLVNDNVVMNHGFTVHPGNILKLSEHKAKYIRDLKIVYEDGQVIVIDKPSGLLSVETNFEKEKTAHAILKRHYAPHKIYVVHRLDFETSGLMVFAKTLDSYNNLKRQLSHRQVTRKYLAIAEGHLEGKGTWSCYLHEDAAYYVHASDNPQEGELAITHFESLGIRQQFSLVGFTLETGKKNQIRVQAAKAGYPLAGDTKYGAKTNKIHRIALHAATLSFCHPTSGKTLSFSSPTPVAFQLLYPN